MALNVGTSTALRLVTMDPKPPPRGLWLYRLDRRLALVGGALSEGGNVFAWCRQVLNVFGPDAVERALATTPPDGHGLTVLPFLAGERAPGWRPDRQGVIAGLGLETTAEQIVVAALEGVALRIALVYALLAPLAAPDHSIVASGGALAHSPGWTQRIADALGRPLALSAVEEASSRGAALLALESLGLLPRLEAASLPGAIVQPDAAHHARYRAALRRQQQLDTRV
jgi:gluconokinase